MEPMMAIQAGLGAASSVIGMGQALGLGRRKAERNQLEQQGKLSRQQADIQHAAQMKMWNETNYEAQVNKLNEAGLNPALLYGKDGGGRTTVGAGIGGGQAANAATTQEANTRSAGMGIQGGVSMAQMKLMESQAKNLDADTANKLGIVPDKTKAETGEITERTRGQKIDNDWKTFLQTPDNGLEGQSIAERQIRLTSNKLIAEMRKIEQEINNLGVDLTKGKSEIERIKADTNLKKQVYDQLQKLNPLEVEGISKQLEILKNNPRNTEEGQWATAVLGWLGELVGLGLKGAMTKSFMTPKKSGNINIHNWGEQ